VELARNAFQDAGYGFDGHADLDPWLVIGLNSNVPGQVGGTVSADDLLRLRETLAANPRRWALVAVHHPVVPVGSRWLDRIGMTNGADLVAVLAAEKRIRACVFGHIHQDFRGEADGTPLLGVPSTCVQFLPQSDDFALDPIAAGYRVIRLYADGSIVTEVVRVPSTLPLDPRAEALAAWLRVLEPMGSGYLPPRPLASDASFRRYFRVALAGRDGATIVAMDAPPEREAITPFITVAGLLRNLGLLAPRILAVNQESGFVLLEDFGDQTFTRALRAGSDEEALYRQAARTLLQLQIAWAEQGATLLATHDLPRYDRGRLMQELSLFLDWYWPKVQGSEAPVPVREAFTSAWHQVLDAMPELPDTLVLRDFHVDNLMLVPRADGAAVDGAAVDGGAVDGGAAYGAAAYGAAVDSGAADGGPAYGRGSDSGAGHGRGSVGDAGHGRESDGRDVVGLLDFQDAVLGSPAYDWVSLLEDARRDVAPQVGVAALATLSASGLWSDANFQHHYRVLGVQRATKIIGIFTRLERRDHKPAYQKHQPRLWRLLTAGLNHPELAPVASWYQRHFYPDGRPCVR